MLHVFTIYSPLDFLGERRAGKRGTLFSHSPFLLLALIATERHDEGVGIGLTHFG